MTVPAKLAHVTAEAFEGGGSLGFGYIPILEAFDDLGLRITAHAGTSAGAITAMLRALAFPASYIRELQESTPWEQFAAYHPPALLRLLARGGWHSIDFARSWIGERIKDAGLPPGVTFAALKRRKGHALHVAATRYVRHIGGGASGEPYIFGPESTPDAPVAAAVLASMAVPLYWPPVEVCGWLFCDGGVAVNHPLSVFADLPPEQVIGVRLDTSREILDDDRDNAVEPYRPSFPGIVVALADMLRRISNQSHIPSALWSRVVRIDVGQESALEFARDDARAARLFAAGEKALAEWLAATE